VDTEHSSTDAGIPASKEEAARQAEASFAQLKPAAAQVARRCVALHWFTPEVIAALLPEGSGETGEEVSAALDALPFIQATGRGHAFQPLTRQGLLARYAQKQPEELTAACTAAAPVYLKSWDDDLAAQEAVYCLAVAGRTDDAKARLHTLLTRFLERQDWQRCADLYDALSEAEAMPSVAPLGAGADYLVARGTAEALRGKLSRALKDLNQAVSADPNLAWVFAQRGEIQARMGHADAALADLARAVALDERLATPLADVGSLLPLVEAYEKDPPAFTRAATVGLGPLAKALGTRGEEYRLDGQPEEALSYFHRALVLEPNLAGVYASRGQVHQYAERLEEALADLNRAIELDPKYAWAYTNRGRIHRYQGRIEEALADFDRALESDPDAAGALAGRGEIRFLYGQYEDAYADLDRSLRLNPFDPWTAARRGEVLQAQGRLRDALADLHRAIAIATHDDPWALAKRGELHLLLGDHGDALSDLNRALELEPDNVEAIANRGQLFQELEKPEEAVADFTRLIERQPDLAAACVRRAECYLDLERYDEAMTDLDAALAREPDHAEALAMRGTTYARLGRTDEALADLARVLDMNPQDDGALAARAEVWLCSGEYGKALADLDQALSLQPEDDWCLYRRSLAHRALGHAEEAERDMASAAKAARRRRREEPSDWANVLNLALYDLALGKSTGARRLCREAIKGGASAVRLRQALRDLEDHLASRPADEDARALCELLRSQTG
jgi:tetratricopeptide (TPR) repeat protein